MRIPAEAAARTVVGTVAVSLDSAPVGHVKFKLAIEDGAAAAPNEPQGEDAHQYKFAFISYASKDREEVLRRVQVLAIVGIEYFQDILSIKPGDRWSRRLEVRHRPVRPLPAFLVDARGSEAVRMGTQRGRLRPGAPGGHRHAAARDTTGDPRGPADGGALGEPEHLHFNDRLLYFMAPPRPDETTRQIQPAANPDSVATCPNCGHLTSSDPDFCEGCGTYLRWEITPDAKSSSVFERFKALSPEVVEAVQSPLVTSRENAWPVLSDIVHGHHPGKERRAAHELLVLLAEDDDSRSVRTAAAAALSGARLDVPGAD